MTSVPFETGQVRMVNETGCRAATPTGLRWRESRGSGTAETASGGAETLHHHLLFLPPPISCLTSSCHPSRVFSPLLLTLPPFYLSSWRFLTLHHHHHHHHLTSTPPYPSLHILRSGLPLDSSHTSPSFAVERCSEVTASFEYENVYQPPLLRPPPPPLPRWGVEWFYSHTAVPVLWDYLHWDHL